VTKIVFVTQVVDPSDPNLGATRAKIAALARRVDEVVVLCDRGSTDALPGNCRLRTFGAPRRSSRAYRFLTGIAAELRERPLAVIAHMIPLYVVAAAPLVRPRRVPLLLWYSHWRAHLVLRAAVAACTGVITVDERSFPLRSPNQSSSTIPPAFAANRLRARDARESFSRKPGNVRSPQFHQPDTR